MNQLCVITTSIFTVNYRRNLMYLRPFVWYYIFNLCGFLFLLESLIWKFLQSKINYLDNLGGLDFSDGKTKPIKRVKLNHLANWEPLYKSYKNVFCFQERLKFWSSWSQKIPRSWQNNLVLFLWNNLILAKLVFNRWLTGKTILTFETIDL